MTVTRVFIHGLESSGSGTKGSYFGTHFPGMIREDYSGTLEERMTQLEGHLAGKNDLILVGSSFGGLMAALFACRRPEQVLRLVLLAPALEYGDFSPYRESPLALPVTLVHGRRDDVVAPGPTREIAARLFRSLDYRLVDDDHSLLEIFPTLDWERLLTAEG